MKDELRHKIEKIEKMLMMLLNDEQKEIIKQFDLEYYKEQAEAAKIMKPDMVLY